MSSINRKEANQRMLQETKAVQSQTKDAVDRIKQQVAETEEIGSQTLEQLRAQGQQIDEITGDIESVSNKLDEANKLQNTFDSWGGNIFGFGKKKALNAAAAEIALRQQEELMNVKEVFEQQKYDAFKSSWKPYNLSLCSNPAIEAPELFVPSIQHTIPNSPWKIDHSLTGIDEEGWTYASDFSSLNKTGVGEAKANWKTYVRRRKWKYTEATLGSSARVADIQARHATRAGKNTNNNNTGSTQGEKIGYVSRQQVAGLKQTGLVSSSMMNKNKNNPDQILDEESAEGLKEVERDDAEIDAGIDSIDSSLDRLNIIAGHMKDETIIQNKKLEKMENAMQTAGEKQSVVNNRLKTHIKKNS